MTDNASLEEPRLITESGVEARVCAVIEPIILDLGYRLVRARLTGQNGLTLQIMAERVDGTFNVSDCEKVSLEISPALDVEDPIDKAYHLEISSPGIDRPLVRRSDFERWLGHLGKLETLKMHNGRKRFKGVLSQLNENMLTLIAEDGEKHEIDVTDLADARLVMTDELIRDALQKDKALREANDVDGDNIELEAANDEFDN